MNQIGPWNHLEIFFGSPVFVHTLRLFFAQVQKFYEVVPDVMPHKTHSDVV